MHTQTPVKKIWGKTQNVKRVGEWGEEFIVGTCTQVAPGIRSKIPAGKKKRGRWSCFWRDSWPNGRRGIEHSGTGGAPVQNPFRRRKSQT